MGFLLHELISAFCLQIQAFLRGLVGGILLVLSIQYVNSLLGCVSFSWPPSLHSPSLDAMTRLKSYGQMLILVGRGAVTATSVALVEELLFRSWLTQEIAADLGYHWGIIFSGLAFSLFQRCIAKFKSCSFQLLNSFFWIFSISFLFFICCQNIYWGQEKHVTQYMTSKSVLLEVR